MLRVSRLTTVSSSVVLSLFPGIAWVYPQLADAKSPIVAQAGDNSLICYMQTNDGKTLNLTALCGQQTTPTVTPPRLSAAASEAAKIPISNVKYDSQFISGQVTNQTRNTVQDVKVNYEVLDNQGNLIDNGFISAQPSTIPPGGSASFRGMTVKGAKVQPTFVQWSN